MQNTELGTQQTFPDLPYENRLIYIAGPFFSPEQAEVIEKIETILDMRNEKYFSPREFGVIADAPMASYRVQRIFDMNIRMVNECNIMIAITDNFDPGTMFEMGLFYNRHRWQESSIITFSPKGYGCNVMIANAVYTHTRTWEELEHALNGHKVDNLEAIE